MKRNALPVFLVTFIIAPAAHGQRILVVDVNGGPGSEFRQIQAAIAAAQPNDVIRVRAGSYDGISVSKPLRIVGDPGVLVGSGAPWPGCAIVVRDLGLGDVVVISGLHDRGVWDFQGVRLGDNQGAVHLDNLVTPAFVVVEDTAQVSFENSQLQAVSVTNSDAAFTDTTSVGVIPYVFGVPADPALLIDDSRVTIAGGTWIGSRGSRLSWCESPGIIMIGTSRLVVTGDSQTVIQGGEALGCGGAPAIRASPGTIVLDPRPALVGTGSSPPIEGSATIVWQPIPHLRTQVEKGELVAALSATAGAQAFLLTSLFVAPVPLASALPDSWVGAPIIVAAGIVPAGVPRVDRIALPTGLLPGSALPLQSAVVVKGQLELSNPAVTVLVR